ncbi:MAG: alpha/beta hydrolase [Acidobacteriota bacterium]|nr:alpha/beta hydrolase [Acidobacteriota bacterium]
MAVVRVNDLHIGYNEARPTWGDSPTGDAVLFLHGVGSDKSAWDAQLEHFGMTHRAVALDYPGYGESDFPASELNREEIARCIFGAMDELKIEEAHVIGLSMGGVIALEMHRQNSSRFRSLTLANTFACHPEAGRIIERSQHVFASMTMRSFAETRVESLLTANAQPALKRKVVETMARIDKRTYAWASVAVWTADYRHYLPSIITPTLVIASDHDQPTPPVLSGELCAAVPTARMEVISAAGHLSNIENPIAFNALVERFISSTANEAS